MEQIHRKERKERKDKKKVSEVMGIFNYQDWRDRVGNVGERHRLLIPEVGYQAGCHQKPTKVDIYWSTMGPEPCWMVDCFCEGKDAVEPGRKTFCVCCVPAEEYREKIVKLALFE